MIHVKEKNVQKNHRQDEEKELGMDYRLPEGIEIESESEREGLGKKENEQWTEYKWEERM